MKNILALMIVSTTCAAVLATHGVAAATINPRVTVLSPAVVNSGGTVTLHGQNLMPSDHSVKLAYKTKYPSSITPSFRNVAGNNTSLSFTAPSNVQPSSLELWYTKVGEQASKVTQIQQQLFVKEAPGITQVKGVPWPLIHRDVLKKGGIVSLIGRNLVPPPGAMTTVKFGNSPVQVQDVTYNANQPLRAGDPPEAYGADVLRLVMPDLPANQSSPFTVMTPGGSATSTVAHYVDPPSVTKVQEYVGGTVGYRDMQEAKLFRGRRYRLVGNGLHVIIPDTPSPTLINYQTAAGTVGGVALTMDHCSETGCPSGDQTVVMFTVPSNATAGMLIVSTFGGETLAGSFQVADAPTGLPVASFTLVPSSVVGGGQVTGSVAFTGTVSPGQSAGLLAIHRDQIYADVMPNIGPFDITSNPVTFTITTKSVSTTRNVGIFASSGGASKSAVLAVVPVQPTAVTLSTTNVVGGQPVTGTVQINGAVPASVGITVALSSNDPTTATVPPTATVNGTTATFTINTPVIPSARPVTISATAGGQTRSATLTVGPVPPPSLASVSVNPTTAVAGQTVGGAVTMTGAVSGAVVALSSNDPSVQVPASVTVNGTSATFQVATSVVTASKSATITATTGGVSRTTTLTVNPLTIQSVTIAPASVSAGGTVTGTVTLNVAAGGNIQVALSSSHPNIATVPAQVPLAAGQRSQIFGVTARSPIAQSTTVTIRATFGTFFREGTVAVTP